MARMPNDAPRSVADPDALDYARMIKAQGVRNGLIEMGPGPDRRGPSRIDPKSLADTAGTAGDMSTLAQITPEAARQLKLDPQALKGSYKVVKKANGLLGPLMTGIEDGAKYRVDRANGMPRDEAAIKNLGGAVLGTSLGGYVEGATLPLGPAVATGAGWMANKDGHMIAQSAADGWAGLKRFGRQIRQTTSEGLSRLNRPGWVQDRMYLP